MRGRKRAGVLAVILAAMPEAALATDGYFQNAYGVKELGRGGTSIAIPDDAFGGANNPATMGFVGDVLDVDAYLFAPSRNASRSGNAFGLNGYANSGDDAFFFPAFGYVHTLTDTISLGISVYANGGMDTDYPGGQIAPFHCGPGAPAANLLCGEGRLGVNLEQFFFAPTITYKVTPNNAFGISPIVAYQRFSAEGLQAFSGLSSAPGNLTNRGFSNSAGVGVRIGWMGKITETLSLGATYASRISMSRFQAYEGLFAEHGEFDIPQNLGAGIAWRPLPKLLLAFDYRWINYSSIAAVGNPSTNFAPLGSNHGPGFGWSDVSVFEFGAEYRLASQWVVRAGYNHNTNPIQARDVTFNILAPGLVQDHVSVGFTYEFAQGYELNAAYMHAFRNTLAGATSPLLPGGGVDKIGLSEDLVGLELQINF
ncbi:MAG: outer membrane protein transport protein [Acidobacteriia bacterium]|nr:outer membrane protein transport protein [Methyloceanibacter sp.]MCL6491419.1 outer membrane protein transport protein [Terriglobia bacterium]